MISMLRATPALLPLVMLALLHALVDTFAMFLQPLWPDLARQYSVGDASVQWSYVSWSLATSVTQLFFGYWGDRFQGGWLIWAGPLLGMLCVSSIGWVDSLWALNCVLFVGGLGVAAFHPEAAAMAGSCLPGSRGRAMSIFAVGGYLGQAAGPVYSGVVTTRSGMAALVWSIGWGIVLLALLMFGLHRAGKSNAAESALSAASASPRRRATRRVSLTDLLRRRGNVLALILTIGTLRVLPAMGLPLALAYIIKDGGGTNEAIGYLQAAFLIGIGVGGIGCATLVRGDHERLVMWLLPIAVAPVLAACAMVNGTWLPLCVSLAGLLMGLAMPVLIGYGQQLIPEAERLASSITMGVTWGLGAALVQAVMASTTPRSAIYAFAAASLASSVLCVALPEARSAPALEA
jgi:MFS transporter, FSR family, fosmidomycin resistance protein